MTIQILVATMDRKNCDFLHDMNVKGDVIVVNQCDRNAFAEINGPDCSVKMICTTKRGLSNSRNEAILQADADIFLTADDDVVYMDNALEVIIKKFEEHPEADVIAFNIDRHNVPENMTGGKQHGGWKMAPANRYYPSVSLAYRRTSFEKANLHFHPLFGAGGLYSSGEESLLLRDARKFGLRIFEAPECIADVDFSASTWFSGYDAKFFFDKGAWVKTAYKHMYFIYKYYFLKLCRKSELKYTEILRCLNDGIRSVR